MTKPFFLKQHLLPGIVAIFFFMISFCGCSERTPTPPPVGTLALSNYLDTLWVDSAKFAKLDPAKRTVFEFRIGGLDTLTLDGWTAPYQTQNPFQDDPDISLLKGRTDSSVTLGQGTYLGNQVLHKEQLKNIQDLVSLKHAPYVLFAPYKYKGHVYYTVFLGFDDPRAKPLIPFTTPPINTNQSSNPSPPKSYSN